MNPESLLHKAAEMLQTEAGEGPGTMFLMNVAGVFYVTRAPSPEETTRVVVRFDCTSFEKGLSAQQWSSLLKKVWSSHKAAQEGATSAEKH